MISQTVSRNSTHVISDLLIVSQFSQVGFKCVKKNLPKNVHCYIVKSENKWLV